MKNLILIALILASFQIQAKNETRLYKANTPTLKWENKTIPAYVKIKINHFNTSSIRFNYEIKVPMTNLSLSFINHKPMKSRFDESKTQFNSRFQPKSNIDYAAILEKNKFYNLSKSGIAIKNL